MARRYDASVKAEERRRMYPILKDMKFGSGRQRHMHIGMIVAKYKIIHIMLTIKGFRKFIKRFIRTTEGVSVIMRKAIAL